MKTFRLALVVLTVGLLCVGNAGCSDAAVAAFEAALAKAKAGDAEAMVLLGIMYDNGEGVIQDYEEAVNWYRKAADLGDAEAMYNLGLMYANGEGVIQDDVEAYAWLNAVAANGDKLVAEILEEITEEWILEQIAEGQKRSREIMKSISKNNPPEATDSDQTN